MPIITPHQLNEYTSRLTDIYAQLEQDVFLKMADILKTGDEQGKEYAIQWQAEKLQQLRLLNLETITMLAEVSGIARQEIISLLRDAGFDTIETVDKQVSTLGLEVLSIPTDIDLLLQSYVNQVFGELDNLVNLVLIDTQQSNGTATEVFKRIIEEATAKAIVGNKTINQVVTETIVKWREKGIPSGFVDRGGRRWDIQNYVDLSVRTTVNNVYNQFFEDRIEEYDLHLVRVDYYSGARPTCARIQGGVASLRRPGQDTQGYPSIYEFKYKEPDGIRGIHCRHRLYPFMEGVSTNNNHPPSVEEANEYYKKMQKQRALEREVRKAKRNLEIAETTGDQTQIEHQKKLIRDRQARVREYVQDNGLVRRYDKERVV